MTFGERLTELRKSKGYTREAFAEYIGISKYTLRNYEYDTNEPGSSFLKQISDLFDVSIDYLMGLTDEKERVMPYQLKASEFEHIKKYRDLDDIGKTHVENVLEWETERVTTYKSYATQISDLESSSHSPLRLVRYYQNLASAGSGEVVFDDGPDERIEIPDIPEYRRVAYAITVNGHSMETLYSDGDTLLVEVTQQIDRGEVGIFIIGDRAFVKMLGETELISLNDEYSNIPLTEDTKCMGRVVGKM